MCVCMYAYIYRVTPGDSGIDPWIRSSALAFKLSLHNPSSVTPLRRATWTTRDRCVYISTPEHGLRESYMYMYVYIHSISAARINR